MIKTKSKEIIQCNECSEEIDSCDDCGTWFEHDDIVYCDKIHSHFCKKCGKPKYERCKVISKNSTLDDFR